MKPGSIVASAVLIATLSVPLYAAPAKVAVVSILPQAYFVERIAGDSFKPLVLVGAGQSPHAYEPSPRQMADLSKATLWFTIGSEFENALKPRIAALYPSLPIVDTTLGIRYRSLEAHSHDEGPDGDDHGESGLDPHVWLGRQASKSIAANMLAALSNADPAGKTTFEARYESLILDIDSVYDELSAELAPLKGKPVFVYHPAFGYLLDDLGIRQEAVETGGKEPTQKTIAALIAEARADGAKVIFVQAQFPASAAKVVADAIGGTVISIDPWQETGLITYGA
ncbi:zinc ABC transporter substrate-binding protein [Spirochaetota bacterium]